MKMDDIDFTIPTETTPKEYYNKLLQTIENQCQAWKDGEVYQKPRIIKVFTKEEFAEWKKYYLKGAYQDPHCKEHYFHFAMSCHMYFYEEGDEVIMVDKLLPFNLTIKDLPGK